MEGDSASIVSKEGCALSADSSILLAVAYSKDLLAVSLLLKKALACTL
jgi:hypothetical protein